jgi:acyl-CoA-binding protein
MNQQPDLQEQFENAVNESRHLSERPSNDVMLQIYALYKQAVEGDINIDPPTNPFDFVGKAKYEAWEGLKGKSTEEAMQDYVDLIARLNTKN